MNKQRLLKAALTPTRRAIIAIDAKCWKLGRRERISLYILGPINKPPNATRRAIAALPVFALPNRAVGGVVGSAVGDAVSGAVGGAVGGTVGGTVGGAVDGLVGG